MTGLESDAFVFFGATGDLAFRQIFPALQALIGRGHLGMPIIGVAKSEMDLGALRARAHESLEQHGGVEPRAFAALAAQLQYINGDYHDPETFRQLRTALGGACRPLYYFAIPPELFATVAEGLAASESHRGARVVEKPFGRDLASARDSTERCISPFRNQRSSGSTTIWGRNPFRTSCTSASPTRCSNRSGTDSTSRACRSRRLKTSASRDGGVSTRRSARSDVVQNHLLEVVALLTMEAPVGRHPDALPDEKQRAFRAMQPLVTTDVVRGQFRGYRNEAGVPFYIRAGKRMPLTATEVRVEFKPPPQSVFDTASVRGADFVRFRLSPNVTISLGARVKLPGEAMVGEAVELLVRHLPGDEMRPYERLLGDAIRCDAMLFVPEGSVEAAWRVVDPVLGNKTALHEYDPSTWGPAEADQIIVAGGGWHNPKLVAPPAHAQTP